MARTKTQRAKTYNLIRAARAFTVCADRIASQVSIPGIKWNLSSPGRNTSREGRSGTALEFYYLTDRRVG